MLKFPQLFCTGATLSIFAYPVISLAQANAKDSARKEFSACYVNPNRPDNSKLIVRDKKLNSSGSVLYKADIYQLNKTSSNKKFISYQYNIKEKSRVIGFFQIDYILQGSSQPKAVWNLRFTGCGPITANQSYPIITYKFNNTNGGIKLEGYRSEKYLGKFTSTNPQTIFGAINQLDAPDFGS